MKKIIATVVIWVLVLGIFSVSNAENTGPKMLNIQEATMFLEWDLQPFLNGREILGWIDTECEDSYMVWCIAGIEEYFIVKAHDVDGIQKVTENEIRELADELVFKLVSCIRIEGDKPRG